MPSASAWPLTQVTADRGADACVIRIRRWPPRLRNSDFQQVRTRRRWFSHEPVQRRVIAAALSSEIETMPPRYLGVIRGIPVNAERLKAKVQQRAVWQYVSFLAGQAEVRC